MKAIKTTKIEYCLCMNLYELNPGQLHTHRLQTTRTSSACYFIEAHSNFSVFHVSSQKRCFFVFFHKKNCAFIHIWLQH